MNCYEILACRPKHKFPIFSWMVRIFQRTSYSHCAIKYDKWYLDSTIQGTVWRTEKEFLDKYEVTKTWSFCEHNKRDIFFWAARYSAKPYSLLQNFGLGLTFIGLLRRNPFGHDENHLNCSELIVLWLRDFLDIKIEDSDSYDLVKTEKLLNTLLKLG
jgi:hypothetical protein